MARCGEKIVQGKNEVPPPRNHIFRWELDITTMSKNTRIKRKLRLFSSQLSSVLEICLAISHSASV